MHRLNDVIENMLLETLARGDTVAPGWRDEIRAIARDLVEKEREACAKVCDEQAKVSGTCGVLRRCHTAAL